VIELGVDRRAAFITRTYAHLFAAILAFAGIEIYLFSSGLAERLAATMLSVSLPWILGGFPLVGWLASRAAHTARSLGAQYVPLARYVVANAIIFGPLLYMARAVAPGAVQSAALAPLVGFGGLTLVAFVPRKDFSFLGALLKWGLIVALILIVAGVVFGFELGTFFSVAMIALAGGAVLYDTSNVLHHYPETKHVAAALQLFASIALMFWYVLLLFMGSRD